MKTISYSFLISVVLPLLITMARSTRIEDFFISGGWLFPSIICGAFWLIVLLPLSATLHFTLRKRITNPRLTWVSLIPSLSFGGYVLFVSLTTTDRTRFKNAFEVELPEQVNELKVSHTGGFDQLHVYQFEAPEGFLQQLLKQKNYQEIDHSPRQKLIRILYSPSSPAQIELPHSSIKLKGYQASDDDRGLYWELYTDESESFIIAISYDI